MPVKKMKIIPTIYGQASHKQKIPYCWYMLIIPRLQKWQEVSPECKDRNTTKICEALPIVLGEASPGEAPGERPGRLCALRQSSTTAQNPHGLGDI
jgi:hypothetical protein